MYRTGRVRTGHWLGTLSIVAVVFLIGACSGPVSTDNSVVVRNITVTPSLLQQGQVGVVEILLTNESGDPLPGKTVYVFAEPNTAGSFNNSAVESDENGVATVLFTATEAGNATISARAEGAPSTMSANVVIEDNLVRSGDGQIVLSITPGLIQADGLSTALVTASVADDRGNPMPDSTVVKFTAGEKFVDVDGDGFWTVNVDSLVYDADGDEQWDPIGTLDNTVYAIGGQATSVYTAGGVAGLVYVKATMGEPGSQVSQDISLSLTSSDSINTISLTPEWQKIQVRGTGGIEWVHILAEAFDANGNSAPEGLPVDFSITAGPGGGESINGDPIGPVTMFTNSLGQATVTLNAGRIAGTVRLRARSGSVVSTATQVTIRSGPPAFISLGASECNVPSWEFVNWSNKMTAVVSDQWGNEVPDSTSVHFGTEQGMIEGAAETQEVPTFRGVAQTFWHSAWPKNDGYVVYWCETSGGTVADTSTFIESGPPAVGTFLSWPDTLVADGATHGEVVIEVLDGNGVFVKENTPIDLKATLGSISSGLLGDGCKSSIYIGEFYSQGLDRDYNYTIPDSGVGGIAVISARAGGFYGFNGSVQVVLTTGPAFTKKSSIDVETSVGYGISVPIEVTIKDRWGNPLGGHRIEAVGDGQGGTVSGSPRYTDQYGVASGFTLTTTTNDSITTTYITVNDLDADYGGISMSKKISLQK